jgi:integrase
VENLYAKLLRIFATAELDKVIRESPCIKIMLPENVRRRVLVLASGQVLQIHGAIPELYRAPVTACGATGVRKGELFGWTTDRMTGPRDDLTMIIDRQQGDKAGTWKPTKTPRSDREIRLGRTASLEVSDHLDKFGPSGDGHVFRTTRGGEVRPGTSRHAWAMTTAEMNLGDRSGWHLLRHYNAALLIRGGISVAALSEHLGHANQQTTYNTYVHLWPDDTDRIVAAVEDHFAELLPAA